MGNPRTITLWSKLVLQQLKLNNNLQTINNDQNPHMGAYTLVLIHILFPFHCLTLQVEARNQIVVFQME